MSNEADWGLVCSFWIDTPTYFERDKLLFCCGYEFATVLEKIRHSDSEFNTTIHRENESRVRMACGKFGRVCKIDACELEHDPQGTWSYLKIEATEQP